ncbi:Vms1/Ankzf1 family peptidyl-tRNA hydrolase [Streptomyces sp. INA 01156]
MLSHRLSRSPQSQIACWAALPRLTPLLELAGQDPDCLVAYIDRTGADFQLRGEIGAQDAGRTEGRQWPIHRTASSDWSERHFQLKVENTWEHNAGKIAEALTSAYEECGADLVVLVGDPRERPAVHGKLPRRSARSRWRRSTEAGPQARPPRSGGGHRAGTAAVHTSSPGRGTRPLPRRTGRHWQADGRGRSRPALVEAAREHRIDTLLIRPDDPELSRETWVGEEPDQLAVRRTDARSLGEDAPIPVRADDALLRSAAVTAADVLIVPPSDEDGPDVPAGGLGALLRWTYEPTPA